MEEICACGQITTANVRSSGQVMLLYPKVNVQWPGEVIVDVSLIFNAGCGMHKEGHDVRNFLPY